MIDDMRLWSHARSRDLKRYASGQLHRPLIFGRRQNSLFAPVSAARARGVVAGRASPDKSRAKRLAKIWCVLTARSCGKTAFVPGWRALRSRQGSLSGKRSRISVFCPNSGHGSSCGFLFRRELVLRLNHLSISTPAHPRPGAALPAGRPLGGERPNSMPHEAGAHSPAHRLPPSVPSGGAFPDLPSPTPSP